MFVCSAPLFVGTVLILKGVGVDVLFVVFVLFVFKSQIPAPAI